MATKAESPQRPEQPAHSQPRTVGEMAQAAQAATAALDRVLAVPNRSNQRAAVAAVHAYFAATEYLWQDNQQPLTA